MIRFKELFKKKMIEEGEESVSSYSSSGAENTDIARAPARIGKKKKKILKKEIPSVSEKLFDQSLLPTGYVFVGKSDKEVSVRTLKYPGLDIFIQYDKNDNITFFRVYDWEKEETNLFLYKNGKVKESKGKGRLIAKDFGLI